MSWDWFNTHPYLTIGGLILLVMFFWLWRKSRKRRAASQKLVSRMGSSNEDVDDRLRQDPGYGYDTPRQTPRGLDLGRVEPQRREPEVRRFDQRSRDTGSFGGRPHWGDNRYEERAPVSRGDFGDPVPAPRSSGVGSFVGGAAVGGVAGFAADRLLHGDRGGDFAGEEARPGTADSDDDSVFGRAERDQSTAFGRDDASGGDFASHELQQDVTDGDGDFGSESRREIAGGNESVFGGDDDERQEAVSDTGGDFGGDAPTEVASSDDGNFGGGSTPDDDWA